MEEKNEIAARAFRELRTVWFNTVLRRFAPEREWEDDRETEIREADNDAMQVRFNEQTEGILRGEPHRVCPRTINDLIVKSVVVEDDGPIEEWWLRGLGGGLAFTKRLGIRFTSSLNDPSEEPELIVFPRHGRLSPIVTINGSVVLRDPTRKQVTDLLVLLIFKGALPHGHDNRPAQD